MATTVVVTGETAEPEGNPQTTEETTPDPMILLGRTLERSENLEATLTQVSAQLETLGNRLESLESWQSSLQNQVTELQEENLEEELEELLEEQESEENQGDLEEVEIEVEIPLPTEETQGEPLKKRGMLARFLLG